MLEMISKSENLYLKQKSESEWMKNNPTVDVVQI